MIMTTHVNPLVFQCINVYMYPILDKIGKQNIKNECVETSLLFYLFCMPCDYEYCSSNHFLTLILTIPTPVYGLLFFSIASVFFFSC